MEAWYILIKTIIVNNLINKCYVLERFFSEINFFILLTTSRAFIIYIYIYIELGSCLYRNYVDKAPSRTTLS